MIETCVMMESGMEEEGATGVAEFNVAALAQASDANPYCALANFEIEKKIGQGQVSPVFKLRICVYRDCCST